MQPQELADAVKKGQVRAAARLMRDLDDAAPGAFEALKLLYPSTGRARIIGVTGSPGVGKSSLVDSMVALLREKGRTVGVVAVDPTSPFSGGAILGDRIRMQRHATDEGVFIRSLATRGAFGGLTASTRGVISVMDAMGKDVVVVETVGVGQDEVDVVSTADTTIIAQAPGMGDDIQAIKAGILEIGDIFVVNKADRDGAERTADEIRGMLALEGGKREDRKNWDPPVILTVANQGRGMEELWQQMERHRELLEADDGRLLKWRRAAKAKAELVDMVRLATIKRLMDRIEAGGELEELARRIVARQTDPYTVCEDVLSRLWA